MMTKKDYDMIARRVGAELDYLGREGTARLALLNTICSLADGFAQANERFDRERFYTACGIRP